MTDSQLREAVAAFRAGILGGRPADGMCFAVCAPLQGYLEMFGIRTELVEVYFAECNHVWLQLTDGRIIDPTADQFGLEPVYVGPPPLVYVSRQARLRPQADEEL